MRLGTIIVDGKEITIYAKPNAADLPWGEIGVDVVLECTGFYYIQGKELRLTSMQALRRLLFPLRQAMTFKTIVYSVNEKTLTADDKIISAASCTTNCLAPMAKALNDYAPIQSGIMSTIHAYTGDQMILDGPHRKGDLQKSKSRCCSTSFLTPPVLQRLSVLLFLNSTASSSVLLREFLFRPVLPLSLLLLLRAADVTVEGINAAMKAAASESFGYNEDPIVSSDVIGMRFGSLFDATQTMVSKIADDLYEVQVVSWYDNENSYTSQMVRTIKYFAELG